MLSAKSRLGSFVQEGILHARLSLGCQDACYVVDTERVKVAVVCDGCSTSNGQKTQNQVGAILGAQHLACGLAKRLTDDVEFDKALHETTEVAVRFFCRLRDGMRIAPIEEYEFVLHKLIFCVMGFAVVDSRFWVFGLGDGCYGDGNGIKILDKAPETFLGYRALRRQYRKYVNKAKPVLEVLSSGSITEAKYIWVGTDGLMKVLSRESAQRDFQKFVNDDFTCARSANGNDTTVMAFRRSFLDDRQTSFSDDIALALLKVSDICEKGATHDQAT